MRATSGIIALFFISAPALAVEFTISGRASRDNAMLEKYDRKEISGTVSFNLGQYFRIGFTHAQDFVTQTGHQAVENESSITYIPYQSSTHLVANSTDITLVLYNGEIIAPYIFGGVIVKQYEQSAKIGDGAESKGSSPPIPGWIAGTGLSVRLNTNFSLKLSYSVSPGREQKPGQPAEESEEVLDRRTTIGLAYEI